MKIKSFYKRLIIINRMKRKILFIDRDGTIIVEPTTDKQIDSLEKLEFIPGAITALAKIATEMDYLLILVTNQDGLGTDSFPENTFWPAQNKMLKTLEGEGVKFDAIHIDKSFDHENLPTRKPGTGMLEDYMTGKYDLENSFVIGDRVTDIQLANNLGCGSIYISNQIHEEADLSTFDWNEIYKFLSSAQRRTASVNRKTKETNISIELNLDGEGKTEINTGLGFFDHMLDQLGKHSGADLKVNVNGDLHIDEHHTIEDTALALGEAYLQALGNKKEIERLNFNK